jgi:MtfA peptidase
MLQSKERRRRRARTAPFPAAWQDTLLNLVPLYRRLPPEDREELHGHIHVLWDEKNVEGAMGLDVDDEMRLVVLSQAAVLLLHRVTDYFPKLVSLVLYPRSYAVQEEVETEDGFVAEVRETRVGESWSIGTLILSWEEIAQDLEDGLQNVILHEFAHQLDIESGDMNGAPVLADRDVRQRWAVVMAQAYDRLAAAAEREEDTVLDPYGAEDPAEFFAVVTEAFFLLPVQLQEVEPDLYGLLRDYFRQDPARW